MAAETLDISLRADITDLKKALAGMEGIGKKEAAAMVGAMVKEYRKAEKAATKLGKTTGAEIGKGFDKASSAAERSASLMGGTFGDISDSVLDLGSRFGELASSIGGVGGAAVAGLGGIVAIGAGIGFAAHATMEWLDTAGDLQKQLEDVSGLPPLSAEHTLALSDYAEAARDADAAAAHASLTLMAELAPAMTSLQHTIVGLTAATTDYTIAGWSIVDVVKRQATGLINASPPMALIALGMRQAAVAGEELSETIEVLTESTIEWEGGMLHSLDAQEKMLVALGMGGRVVEDLDRKTKSTAKSSRDHAAAMREAWIEANKYQSTINEAVQSFDDLYLAEVRAAKAQEEFNKTFAEGIAAASAGLDELPDQVDEASAAIQETMTRFYAEMAAASATSILGTIEQLADAELDILERQIQTRRELFLAGQDERDVAREKLEAEIEAGTLTEAQAQARLAAIAAEGNAARKENRATKKEEEKAIIKAFKAKQTAQIAEATIQAATNTLALIPAFAYLGLGAPAAAAAVSLGALAASVSTIKAQQPPEFPMGGTQSPDHFTAGVSPGESILTRDATAALGGPEGVAQTNRGTTGLGGLGGGGPVTLVLDGRAMGAAVLSSMAAPAIARDADRRAGTLPGIKGSR